MQDVKLTDEEIEKFNKIYDKAWSLHKGNVVLRQIYYMKLRFIRKLRLRK
ncbi:hypothetical protein Bccel_3453 [Pseudobacteroides cellulosolvens ATCC 35603 = DSM 2933]|uniref:Uncharacterized protein n=1 Tax=Pseudobacteroides cellulosolvens ATCC 35603 = DSM 2933 TaxID=398512 RepID=A0A0L6JQV5_9FIRM|nr:hypothetical protein [Pseudobacteroides cellulosolvens]KNY28179.1 hypothetical protein Bccel_3453 [Pseudobacteroides cellulosolvens ATCC 35603 = DSM 2933]